MQDSPDYNELLDQEVWDFIERTDRWYPADAVERSIEEQRAVYATMCSEFHGDHPAGVSATDDVIESDGHRIPVRRYIFADVKSASTKVGAAAHIIYIHGGGFVVGDLDSHDDVCAELCAQTTLSVTSVDYRLSPEHKHPAAFNDCLSVITSEIARVGEPMLLCGDSAGGNLCAAVTHRLRTKQDQSPILGQVLIYPVLGTRCIGGSYVLHANAPMLTSSDVNYYLNVRVDTALPISDVSFAPLHDTDFSNLPPTLVLSAECDPVSDDGKLYCDSIKAAGGQAQWRCETGLVHGYLRARHSSNRASESFKTVITALIEFANARPDANAYRQS